MMLNVKNIQKHKDMSEFQYMCERNAIQNLLWGYGVKEPLLLMRCGIYIKDCNFSETGCFSTLFSRPILDTQVGDIVGDITEGEDWDIIDDNLENGNPVLINVDVFEMPYKNSTYYQKNHGAHTVIIEKKCDKDYWILDWYHPDYYYGRISQDILKRARLSENEKNQISVFSGFPIKASYRLTRMNKLSSNIEVEQSILHAFYISLKQLLTMGGGLEFLSSISSKTPQWLYVEGHSSYLRTTESLFFLNLELKLMIMFLHRIQADKLFNNYSFSDIINNVCQIKSVEEKLKNRILFSYRKNDVISNTIWVNSTEALYKSVKLYCENVIRFLKDVKGFDL